MRVATSPDESEVTTPSVVRRDAGIPDHPEPATRFIRARSPCQYDGVVTFIPMVIAGRPDVVVVVVVEVGVDVDVVVDVLVVVVVLVELVVNRLADNVVTARDNMLLNAPLPFDVVLPPDSAKSAARAPPTLKVVIIAKSATDF
jgi:hypothetical protein